MTWGTITVGRLTLREDFPAQVTDTGLTLKGQESTPPVTELELERRREDLLGLVGALLPITFTDKARLDGYYRVRNVKADYLKATGHGILTLDWTLECDRLGTEFEVDLESRLSGPQTRNTSHAVTGERWHAPALGHYGYWSGTTTPTVVTRTGTEGAMLVYRNVPNFHPRWGAAPGQCLVGRSRFIDTLGERSGINVSPATSGWELSNSLVRVRPLAAGGVLEVAAWTGGAWQPIAWDLLAGGSTLGAPRSVTLIRNELEHVVVRLMWATAAAPGRVTADLMLCRGARFLELYVQSQSSTTLAVARGVAEAGTAGTGHLRATVNDAAGNRYVVGSAQAFTTDLANGAISKAATRTLDVFLGVAAGGSGAVAGDTPADLTAQYLGTPGELVVPVRR